MKSAVDFFSNRSEIPALENEVSLEIRESNVIRAVIFMIFSILISVTIILNYSSKINSGTPVEITWRHNVILLNKIVSGIFIILAASGILLYKLRKSQSALSSVLVAAVIVVIPLWDAIGSVLDQQVTSSIISFALVCLVTSVGLLMPPVLAIIGYSITFIVFYFGLPITQHHQDQLEFNRIAGFCCTMTALGLSIFFWRNNLVKLRQGKIILQQKKELEYNYEKLLSTSEELKKAIATKDKFFSILGHDLRGPLTATLSLTQMMNANVFENEKEEGEKAMKLVEGGLQNIIKLLEDLLLWSGTQTNSIIFNPENLRLDEIVKNNIQLLHLSANKKGINLVSHVHSELWIQADKNMLNTILRNLLSNAIKFSNQGTNIEVFAEVSHHHETDENIITVAVNDHGVGISEATLQNLFKVEHKTTTLGTHKETGTGLGLTLCKELAEKHNGSISVESTPGQGSKFMIHFPAE